MDFHDFLTRLESLDWHPAGYIDPTVLELLGEIGTDPKLIWEFIRSWDDQNLEKRQLRCHETTTTNCNTEYGSTSTSRPPTAGAATPRYRITIATH